MKLHQNVASVAPVCMVENVKILAPVLTALVHKIILASAVNTNSTHVKLVYVRMELHVQMKGMVILARVHLDLQERTAMKISSTVKKIRALHRQLVLIYLEDFIANVLSI